MGDELDGARLRQQPDRDGNFNDIYEHSELRVRERGLDDFEVYTRHVDPRTRAAWWKAALRSPRFKSTETKRCQFGAAGADEHAMRLWQRTSCRRRSLRRLAAFVQAMFEPSYRRRELAKLPILT